MVFAKIVTVSDVITSVQSSMDALG